MSDEDEIIEVTAKTIWGYADESAKMSERIASLESQLAEERRKREEAEHIGDFMFESAIERFWSKVNKSTDGCWHWAATKNPSGYGSFWIAGKIMLAHRIAWLLTGHAIPDGLWVLHRCDVRDCVNPSHLFTGTRHDNIDDAIQKGRMRSDYCKKGHLKTKENTRPHKTSRLDRHGKQQEYLVCLECKRVANLRVSARRKAARAALDSLDRKET